MPTRYGGARAATKEEVGALTSQEELDAVAAYEFSRGRRTAEFAVFHAVVGTDRQYSRNEFVTLLATTRGPRELHAIWFGLLTVAVLTVPALAEMSDRSRAHLELLDLPPAATSFRDLILEKRDITAITAYLVDRDPMTQVMDMYDLAVATVGALFEHGTSSGGGWHEKWRMYAQIVATKDQPERPAATEAG